MILTLEYLHSKGILYRDIRPESIMVNAQGYLQLIDFGKAKLLTKKKNFRTFTIMETTHYSAPETINAKGYSFNADLWSVGVCLYEFICGGLPFGEDLTDIYNEIMHSKFKFPTFFKDRNAKRLIDQLLSEQPEARLGTSYASLKANNWFDDLDWDKLYSKELAPPYIPSNDQILQPKEIENLLKSQKPVSKILKEQQLNLSQAYKSNWDCDF